MSKKHENYSILNLIGYGLAKFDKDLISEFGFKTRQDFFRYFVNLGVADTENTIKNRMDLFDYFFPENPRKGWWQKGDAYKHRKDFIDAIFGSENVHGYANLIRLYLKKNFNLKCQNISTTPIFNSKFKRLQETGLEAELFFINNYQNIDIFKGGILQDARMYGDGYDFQIDVGKSSFLSEVKGIRGKNGTFRMSENEYKKALEYNKDYFITIVINLDDLPRLITINNPAKELNFRQVILRSKEIKEYHLIGNLC